MTKVFVTVGTTPFPSLVRYFDRPSTTCDIIIQTADESVVGKFARCITFTPKVEEYYSWADVIVTHAGAGSVYSLLESGRRIVVVPNLDRSDKHQLELADYVERNRFAMVVRQLSDDDAIDQMIESCMRFEARPYVKNDFFMGGAILDLLERAGRQRKNR